MEQEKDDEWKRSKQLAYKVEAAKRDRGTGLLQRGRFYGDWTEQVREAEAGGKEAAIVFIDMGFLKYFNDAGGRPVGDAALRKAAELMELAIKEVGVEGEAYRYGGDEFAIRVTGGRKDAEAVVKALSELRESAGRIPDREGLRAQHRSDEQEVVGNSRADYAPTELVFNSGIAELKDFNEILNDLRRTGELDKILLKQGIIESEFKAELLVKLADASLTREKAVSRFRILLDLMRDPAYRDEGSAHHLRAESIIRYSQKSIFGAQGGDALLRSLFARYDDLAPEEMDAEIEAFVSDRSEKVAQIVASEKDLTDQLIELHTVRNRLLNEVERLADELGTEHERVLDLQVRLKEAEQARADLVAARTQIKTSTIDRKV
jgi:diguanylate cyclase (GGDEF)-like protein